MDTAETHFVDPWPEGGTRRQNNPENKQKKPEETRSNQKKPEED